MAKVAKHIEESASPEEPKQIRVDKRTAAEIAFDKAREKRVRIFLIIIFIFPLNMWQSTGGNSG